MMRPLSYIAIVVLSALFWIGVGHLAIHINQRGGIADAPSVLSMLLLAGGVALLTAGFVLREAGMRWIDDARSFALAGAGRVVLCIGALVLAAGSGSVATVAVIAP